MKSEMDSMYSNHVWTLVDEPKDIKPIGCKWIYKRKLGPKMMSVMIHVWDEITDVIDNAEKLLNLPFGKLLIWKVKKFLGNVLSWLVVSIMYHNTSSVVSLVGSRVKPDDYDDFIAFALDDSSESSNSDNMTIIHTIVYRLQNHALDLPTAQTTSDALMILADTYTIPTIIQISKQIQKQELLQLMPLEWLTNYEQFHQNSEPVQTSQVVFERRPDRQVKLSFQSPDKPNPESPRLSYTAMITAVSTKQESNLPIYGFSSEGYRVYPDKVNSHFLWDVPEAHMSPSVPPVPEKSSKPSSSLWFTFDDNPCHKWKARHQEFATWIDVQMTSPNAQSQSVLREFCSKFTGSLQDWFESLGEYRQLQLIQSTIPIALAVIYEQFIGEPVASTEASQKEYHQMKCCSLKRHHLEMHYKRMSMLYYKLNGFNDPSLKHVFAASLPPELQPELQRQLTAFNLDIANVSLGKIFQLTMLCLDKICEQKYFFKDLIEHKEPFASACKKPYLKIQCKDDKKCTCPTTKKKHFQKHFHKSSSKKPKKPYRYFRKKDPSQFRKKKYNRCFICKKRGHFARNCPNKSAKVVRLIQHLQQSSILSDHEDVESIFSEQSEKDDHTAFILADSTDSNPDDISVISTI
ncbi:hypothetical protein KPL71_026443 [Citrus sinensis]|uniref:Uncharacterized protein n=1 Tax=Citrus sinensis TaxID=2711 RepID=A0ACB8HZF4_CITSI|nr:hypothetical protein KPL71_026443 [Citrus sinensis]